ncbi:MAG: DNA starvation/stationary phase protection protein [Bdellovibrionales bacterium]|jgi:starvation-inducible DNA-binding protein
MGTITALHKDLQPDGAVVLALQKVLAGTYGLYMVTHNYHWNVEGEKFVPLHALFERQYNESFLAVDLIAERIRALGAYVSPFEDGNLIQLSRMTSHSSNKKTKANVHADQMVSNLIKLTGDVIGLCQLAKEKAQDVEDGETENLMVELITAHQKALWMLESTLK